MFVHLTNLTCLDQQEYPGDDEIQIIISIDNKTRDTFSHDMNRFSKNNWDLSGTDAYNVENIMTIQIKEKDVVNDDIIGTVTIVQQDENHKTSQKVEGARARYKLSWEYVKINEIA